MGSTDSDEKKALKANIIDLVIHSSGLRRTGYHASELEDLLEGHSESEIREAANELADSNPWVKFKGDYVSVTNKSKATGKLQTLREDIYSYD